MTKLYVYSEWNGTTYSTVDYFYATSKAQAKHLLQELYREFYDDCRRVRKMEQDQLDKYNAEYEKYTTEYKRLREQVSPENMRKLQQLKKPDRWDGFLTDENRPFWNEFHNKKLQFCSNLPFMEYEMSEDEFVNKGMENLQIVQINKNISRWKQDGD